MQVQGAAGAEKLYNGPFDAASKIYNAHGIKGIFKGTPITILREIWTYGLYFWAYECAVRYLVKPTEKKI